MRTRTMVGLSVLLGLAAFDLARAQPTVGVVQTLVLEDATGAIVGAVHNLHESNETSAVLAFERNGRLFAVRVSEEGVLHGLPYPAIVAFFAGAGCTGQAYISSPQVPFVGQSPTAPAGCRPWLICAPWCRTQSSTTAA